MAAAWRLLTTAGFEDVLEIGRQARLKVVRPLRAKTRAIGAASLRLGVQERLAADGSIITLIDESRSRARLRIAKNSCAGIRRAVLSFFVS